MDWILDRLSGTYRESELSDEACATTGSDGLMSAVDKAKLDALSGAAVILPINESDVTGLTNDLSNKVNTSSVGVANGVASLDNSGKLPSAQLSTNTAGGVPLIDTNGKIPVSVVPNVNAEVKSVANKAGRLALPINNVNLVLCLQSDTQWMWAVNKGIDPSVEANWIDCGSTAAAVVSVNGSSGAVTISCATLGAVPTTTKVNGKALSGDITLALSDIIAAGTDTTKFLRNDLTWATPPGLGSGVQASYMRATGSSNQLVRAGYIVSLSPSSSAGSDITYSANCFLLKANKTYSLRGSIGGANFTTTGNSFLLAQWRIGQTGGSGSLIGVPASIDASANSTTKQHACYMAEAEYTPSADTWVHLEVTSVGTDVYIGDGNVASAWIEVIAGAAPVTGQSVDYVQCLPTTTSSTGVLNITKSSGNLSVGSNLITLYANKTYYLFSALHFRGATYAAWRWEDSAGNALIGVCTGTSAGNSSSDPIATVPATGYYTPTSTIQVRVNVTSIAGTSGMDVNSSSIMVQQIGTSSVTVMTGATSSTNGAAGTVPAPMAGKNDGYLRGDATWDEMVWVPFTPTITATTTNPSLGTGYTFKCYYRIIGKTLSIRFLYLPGSGTASGSGNYKINISNIPVTIDTSQLIIDGTGYGDSQIGNGWITNGSTTYNAPCKIDVLSTTELGIWVLQVWNTGGNAGFWSNTVHAINSKLTFTAEIPIL